MESLIGLIIGIVILLFILNPNGKGPAFGKIKLPNWASRLNAGQVWGIRLFDDNEWIKKILLFIFKAAMGFIMLLIALFKFSFLKAKKMAFK